jgi:hypothetical protein
MIYNYYEYNIQVTQYHKNFHYTIISDTSLVFQCILLLYLFSLRIANNFNQEYLLF